MVSRLVEEESVKLTCFSLLNVIIYLSLICLVSENRRDTNVDLFIYLFAIGNIIG